jgi:hypothetical protein
LHGEIKIRRSVSVKNGPLPSLDIYLEEVNPFVREV